MQPRKKRKRADLSKYPSVSGFNKSLDGRSFDLVSPRPRARAKSVYPTVPGFDRSAHGESFDLSQDTPGANDARVFAQQLNKYGAIVVPVLDASSRRKWNDEMATAMDEFPEYKKKGGLAVKRVLGGFGAYGNPSSFHHPTIRRLRRKLKSKAVPIFKEYVQQKFTGTSSDTRLEMLFDRVCVRNPVFGNVTAEMWHRDIYDGKGFKLRQLPRTLPPLSPGAEDSRDIITGGWLNLSSGDQKFVGIMGSHDTSDAHAAQAGAERESAGFAMLTQQQVTEQDVGGRLERQAGKRFGSCTTDDLGKTVVPPGHMLIFFQRLLHSVESPKKSAQTDEFSLRYFSGFRLTQEQNPLFQDTLRVIQNGGVPRIPSGQTPPMYSANHYSFFNKNHPDAIEKFREWAGTTFVSQVLFARKTKDGRVYHTPGSPNDTEPSANKGRYMMSLAGYRLMADKYIYSNADIAVLYPERLFPRPVQRRV